MHTQLRRWSHGFVQNVRLHWRGILPHHFLRSSVAVALWDAMIASLAFLIVLPLLIVFLSPWFALGYVVDWTGRARSRRARRGGQDGSFGARSSASRASTRFAS